LRGVGIPPALRKQNEEALTMKRWWLTPVLALSLAAAVQAAPQVEADPNKDYPIDAQAGPYVIVAATYEGDDAGDLARQLVYYLRKAHNLPAYYNYNHADANRARLEADRQRWKQEHPEVPFRHEQVTKVDQYSVLIGGFDSFEHASDFCKNKLRDPKLFPMPPLKLPGNKSPFGVNVVYKTDPKTGEIVIDEKTHKPVAVEAHYVSPYNSSFPSRNPALGAANKAYDPFLKVLNAEEENSLLKCQAPWTMAVQSYGGDAKYVPITQKSSPQNSVISNFVDNLWGGDKPVGEAKLNGAAAQARETAKVLRELGFEAYVLHTRHYSIVTIGGFSGPADPAMVNTANRLAELKLIDHLHLLKNPTSCEVPRP
jgi:hypothetical protein